MDPVLSEKGFEFVFFAKSAMSQVRAAAALMAGGGSNPCHLVLSEASELWEMGDVY